MRFASSVRSKAVFCPKVCFSLFCVESSFFSGSYNILCLNRRFPKNQPFLVKTAFCIKCRLRKTFFCPKLRFSLLSVESTVFLGLTPFCVKTWLLLKINRVL